MRGLVRFSTAKRLERSSKTFNPSTGVETCRADLCQLNGFNGV